MDPQIISALQNASTSSEFTTAIEAIPREQKFYNEQFRDLILQKKDLITDCASADAISRYLLDFLDKDSPYYESNRLIMRTSLNRDLFIHILLPQVSGEALYFAARSVCRIVQDAEAAQLYGTSESFKAILSCFHRVTTPDGARWITAALGNIFSDNPSSNELLNDIPGVVDAFATLVPHAATENVAEWIINALLRTLENNEELQRNFASRQWIDNIKEMEIRVSDKANAKILLGYLIDPQSVITTLQTVSTSSEFTVAVKDIPRSDKFYNKQIRDLILQKKDLISDSASADAVTELFYFFSRKESKLPLLRTSEIHDLIVNTLASKVSAGHSVRFLGSLICCIVQGKSSAELYSTTESLKVILSWFHRVTTPEGSKWIATALHNILLYNPSSNKLLNDIPGVVEAFSALIPHATTSDTAEWIIDALQKALQQNEELQRKFVSQQWIENIKKMESLVVNKYSAKTLRSYLIDPQSVIIPLQNASTSSEFAAAVNDIPGSHKCYNEDFRDLILQKKDLIADSASADAVTEFFYYFYFFSLEESKSPLLRTSEIHDLIINILASKISFGDSVLCLGFLISGIARDEPAAKLYSTTKSLKAILSCFHRVSTSDGAKWIATALFSVLYFHSDCNKLLNVVHGVDEAFSALLPHATNDDAATWIINALRSILTDNEKLQQKFTSHQWIDSIKKLESLVSDKANAKSLLGYFVDPQSVIVPLQNASTSSDLASVVKEIPGGDKFYNENIRDLILQKKDLIADSASADAVVEFFDFFSRRKSRRPVIRTSEFRDLIISILAPKISAGESVYHLGRLICNIVQDKPSAELYSTTESFKAILSCFHRVTNPENVRWIAAALHNVVYFNPSSVQLLNQYPNLGSCFVNIFCYATTDATAVWVLVLLQHMLSLNQVICDQLASEDSVAHIARLVERCPGPDRLTFVSPAVNFAREAVRPENNERLINTLRRVLDCQSSSSTESYLSTCVGVLTNPSCCTSSRGSTPTNNDAFDHQPVMNGRTVLNERTNGTGSPRLLLEVDNLPINTTPKLRY